MSIEESRSAMDHAAATRSFATFSAMMLSAACAEIRSEFQCKSDAECVRDAIAGVCEATGYCGFPDANCLVTQRRYAPHAGELSDSCVVTGRYQWVAPEGDNAAAGTESDPWQTLAFGMTQLGPGDALLAKPGIYEEALVDDIPAGESWKRPFTLASVPPRAATLRSMVPTLGFGALGVTNQRYIVVDGFVIDGAVGGDTSAVVIKQDHIELRDCVVTGSPTQGIFLGYQSSGEGGWNVLRGLDIHNNGTSFSANPPCGFCDAGMTSCDCDATGFCANAGCAPNTMCPPCGGAGGIEVDSGDNLIERCVIRDNEGAGITVSGGSDNVVRRNVIAGFGPSQSTVGILVFSGDGTLVYDNVVHEPRLLSANLGDWGINVWSPDARIFANTVVGTLLEVQSQAMGATVQNNIADAFYAAGALVETACTGGSSALPGGGTIGPNCTTGEFPHFVDPAGGDYHLVASSPARNAGVTLPDVTIDFDGKPRPAGAGFDIGAFEYAE